MKLSNRKVLPLHSSMPLMKLNYGFGGDEMRDQAAALSSRINTIVEAIVAALMLALVLVVWLGVMDRYYFSWQLPWPEVVARYLMIWLRCLQFLLEFRDE